MATTALPNGYRSSTEYPLEEEHTDAIIQVATYHRNDFCRSVIWYPRQEHDAIRTSIATPFERTSNAKPGLLDRLPLELAYEVVLYLDMQSLFHLRQASLGSRRMVDSVHQYHLVASHGLNLLCALLRTQHAARVSLSDFHDALSTKSCSICGKFSGFVSLLSWTRCCFPCLQGAPETQIKSLAAIRKLLGLKKAQVDQLKCIKTIPGTYTLEENTYKSRIAIASLAQAKSLFKPENEAPAQAQPADWEPSQKFNYMGSCALPYYNRRNGMVEEGLSCAGCQLALEQRLAGSGMEEKALRVRDMVYARDEFLQHFRWCKQAQLLWESSEQGTRRPAKLPEAARVRGYFRDRG